MKKNLVISLISSALSLVSVSALATSYPHTVPYFFTNNSTHSLVITLESPTDVYFPGEHGQKVAPKSKTRIDVIKGVIPYYKIVAGSTNIYNCDVKERGKLESSTKYTINANLTCNATK